MKSERDWPWGPRTLCIERETLLPLIEKLIGTTPTCTKLRSHTGLSNDTCNKLLYGSPGEQFRLETLEGLAEQLGVPVYAFTTSIDKSRLSSENLIENLRRRADMRLLAGCFEWMASGEVELFDECVHFAHTLSDPIRPNRRTFAVDPPEGHRFWWVFEVTHNAAAFQARVSHVPKIRSVKLLIDYGELMHRQGSVSADSVLMQYAGQTKPTLHQQRFRFAIWSAGKIESNVIRSKDPFEIREVSRLGGVDGRRIYSDRGNGTVVFGRWKVLQNPPYPDNRVKPSG